MITNGVISLQNTLHVFARIAPKPEHKRDAANAIAASLAKTRAEPGCLNFDLFEGQDDDCLYLVEEWTDQAALDFHYAQPYITEVFAAYENWLTAPVEVTKFHRLNTP